jgi:thiamine-phosphate pyrophosphorylase
MVERNRHRATVSPRHGITVENCPTLIRAGADFLAVVGGVWNHPEGPAAAVRAFNRAMADTAGT